MYAAVVDDVGLDHAVAVGGDNLCQGVAQEVVAHVSQVEGLVGVGRRILYHHQGRLRRGGGQPILLLGVDVVQQFNPGRRGNGEVEEALDDVVGGHGGLVGGEVFAYLLRRLFRSLARHAQEGEHHQGQVSFKLFLRLLQLHVLCGHVLPVECLEAVHDGGGQFFFYLHG